MFRAEGLLHNVREEGASVYTTTQPRTPDRTATLNPVVPGTDDDSSRTVTASRPDVGCVDWYLYPVNRKPRAPESSGSAPRDGAAAPAGENPLA